MATWIDVSVRLKSGMAHWPDNPPVAIERVKDMERGDNCTVSTLSMGSHTGTHMDAPLHFVRTGKGLDEMPLEATIGRARVVAVDDPESIKVEHLEGLRAGERVLFRTRNSERCWKTAAFVEDFVYVSTEAARRLAEIGVLPVGVDYLSVGGYKKNGQELHEALLGASIWIIEGLDLSGAPPGEYELICLPLRIARGDGAPCRAVLRRLP